MIEGNGNRLIHGDSFQGADRRGTVQKGMQQRNRREWTVLVGLLCFVMALSVTMLCVGKLWYSPELALKAIVTGPQHSDYFTIGVLRLPRMLAALLSGLAFGMAGCTFQTLLRNPLASPDMIGINAGASAAAVFGIVVLQWSGLPLSALAVTTGLFTALVIYFLSVNPSALQQQIFSSGRLILIGISIQALLGAVISMLLLKASQYDVQGAMRWLSGSLHTMQLKETLPLLFAVIFAGGYLVATKRQLNLLALGDDIATALGLKVSTTRLRLIGAAVILTAVASAVTGPIAFVAFLAGPIARGLGGRGEGHPMLAGLVGAVIVLASDLIGQHALPLKLPVGVITGLVGAPYLLGLLIQYHRKGGMAS